MDSTQNIERDIGIDNKSEILRAANKKAINESSKDLIHNSLDPFFIDEDNLRLKENIFDSFLENLFGKNINIENLHNIDLNDDNLGKRLLVCKLK